MELLLSVTPVTKTCVFVTVTAQDAVLFPSAVVTVIVAIPSFIAVTLPSWFTVTIPSLEEVHVTALLVAFSGATIADNVSVLPSTNDMELLLRITPVTAPPERTTRNPIMLFR